LPGFVFSYQPVMVNADVAENDAIGRHHFAQIGYGALGTDGNRIRGAGRHRSRIPSLAPSRNAVQPGIMLASSARRGQKLLQKEFGVAHNAEFGPEVPANFSGVYINVNQFGGRNVVVESRQPSTGGAV